MQPFVWDRSLETGIAIVDAQHRGLFDTVNRFGETLAAREQLEPDELEQVLTDLAAYASEHFSTEEGIVRAAGIPEPLVAAHHEQHASFFVEVSRMEREMISGARGSAERLFHFLTHWLVHHILGSDQEMARRVHASERHEHEPSAAAARPAETGATALLLHALEGLFEVVQERNRELSAFAETLERRVEERTAELAMANARLETMAMTDVLTGLANRRHAMERLWRMWSDPRSSEEPISVLLIDADYFKRVNDELGHDAGDTVLKTLAAEIKNAVRTDDLVCRLGGDELLVICPRTPHRGAVQVAEAVRARVAALSVELEGGAWKGSVSIGVATRGPAMHRPEDLLKLADLGVYAAKAAGKGCVRYVEPEPAAELGQKFSSVALSH